MQDRVNLSLFGQLFRELHFLKPTALRMGYTHPMDDGQERTFKVKFEGEGVDDYGGPYREVFAQIPTELQMTPPSGSMSECILPLLLPTRAEENFLLNPAMVSESALGMYSFVGQLMGIGLRCKVPISAF